MGINTESPPLPLPQITLCNHALRSSGGIERYLQSLVKGLHARGIRPTVVAKRFDASLPEYSWVDPVRVQVGWLPSKLRDAWFDLRLRQLKDHRSWFPLIALNQTGAADIAICGSNHLAHLRAMNQGLRWHDRLKVHVEECHLREAKIIIAHSQLLAEQAQQFYSVPAAKIHVVYPPVDTTKFFPVDAQQRVRLRNQLSLPIDIPVFLLASTGHARKGLDLAVEALGQDPSRACLVVAGRPPGVSAPALRYLGYRTDMQDIYRAVDCTLLASRYEPFGLVGIESVLCGTPIIAAEQVGCAEVIHPAAAWRFNIHRKGSLEQAIQAFIDDWRLDGARIETPLSQLAYDPSVSAHIAVLLRHVEALLDRRAQTLQYSKDL